MTMPKISAEDALGVALSMQETLKAQANPDLALSRSVGRFVEKGLFISTAWVPDGFKPYETAVGHPRYGGALFVVEAYDTADEAKAGHEKWLHTFKNGPLPDEITEVVNCPSAKVRDQMTGHPKVLRRAD